MFVRFIDSQAGCPISITSASWPCEDSRLLLCKVYFPEIQAWESCRYSVKLCRTSRVYTNFVLSENSYNDLVHIHHPGSHRAYLCRVRADDFLSTREAFLAVYKWLIGEQNDLSPEFGKFGDHLVDSLDRGPNEILQFSSFLLSCQVGFRNIFRDRVNDDTERRSLAEDDGAANQRIRRED